MLVRIWLVAGLYFIVFALLGTDRYVAHRSAEDLGIFYQTIASAFAGFSNTIEGASHFTVHFSPILYLVAPLVWWTHSALPLVLVSAAANATAAPALFLIARKRVPEPAAMAIAVVALIYPPLCGVTFADFHENSFVVPTIAWLLHALDARKFPLALGFALLALSIKEDEAIFVASLALAAGIYFGRRGERNAIPYTVAMLACAVIVFAGYFSIVRPLAGGHGPWHPTVLYTHTQPAAQTSLVRGLGDRLGYVVLAFAPLAFLPFGSRVLLLAILPFAEVLLPRAPVTFTMGQHYAAVWIPYVLVAFTLAACKLYNRDSRTARRAVIACYAVALIVFVIANPLHPRYFLRWPQARDARLDAFISTLPRDIEVGTQEEAYTHMGFFPKATLGIERYPRYALFDWEYPDSNWIIRDGPIIRRESVRGRYRLARSQDGIELYERVGSRPHDIPATNPAW